MKNWLLMGLFLFCCGCSSSDHTLRVAASSVPHADILEAIKEDLKDKGIELRIIEVDDYNIPNRMLDENQIDANFFQHKPFLEEQVRLHGYALSPLASVHIEPLGIYSSVYKSLGEVKERSTVAIPNDATNEARALMLLEDVGLIKLKETKSKYLLTVLDIAENPKNLRFEDLDAPFLARALSDVDLAVIPANFALQADLDPLKDALALEATDSPYANIVVVRSGELHRDEFERFKQALNSEKMRLFIEEKYKGAILPAFQRR
ncbi:MAG: Methionine-binding lipoprotein MetQ [Chlamydiales bacterium]|nr:Methionine-binding lipoprotein MetQ [Chlamydiales bacterium]